METFKIENVVTNVTPIEHKYAFNSLQECQSKVTELKQTENLTGLHCTGG